MERARRANKYSDEALQNTRSGYASLYALSASTNLLRGSAPYLLHVRASIVSAAALKIWLKCLLHGLHRLKLCPCRRMHAQSYVRWGPGDAITA